MGTAADENLEQFLTQRGLVWSVTGLERHMSLCNEWKNLFGDYSRWLREKQGDKAQFEYTHQLAESIMIVPFLGSVAGKHSIGKLGPRKAAYECRCDGALSDVSAFKDTDFFIVPGDFGWTMIHTHEDYELGGPYFIRKDWIRSRSMGLHHDA